MDRLTSAQISEWEAYSRLDPIGSWRDDYRMAYISSVITNLMISVYGRTNAKLTTPNDFMPNWGIEEGSEQEVKKQSVEEMKQILLSIANAQNKKVQAENVNKFTPPKALRQPKNKKQ